MRIPHWIKQGSRGCADSTPLNAVRPGSVGSRRLHTVCEEARCPNRPLCFQKPTATFLILGNACTRSCGFCAVQHGLTYQPDINEPIAIAEAAAEMGLRHVVVTSVTRDDLPDGGASHFAETVRCIRQYLPGSTVELLIPDFKGDDAALQTVLASGPDILNHNVETVSRLYPTVRPQADYARSLRLLKTAKDHAPSAKTKSGLMVGLGETFDEVRQVLQDLRGVSCDAVTIGQYLMPTKKHLPVVEYIHPAVFESLRKEASSLGFRFVAAGPLVRSSMNAERLFDEPLKAL
ncbi:MAG TPA: lipoyl synthase [Dissulfurispiraceae bacterium]|nr:lipoyl synthase [Dissulfurispiraceae bacterium]